ncbi:MAG: type IV pilus assembly protein PilM [Victivallales bacterium]
MAKTDIILAIDIGADSIKLAEFSYPPGGKFVLEKFAFAEYGGDLKEEELLSALTDKLASVLTEHQFTAKKVMISISGQAAFIRFVKLPPMSDKEDKVKQIVEYEAKQNVPFPIDEVVWDYQLISTGVENEIEVMFIVVKDTVVEELTNAIEKFGKEIGVVDVAPVACYNAARANEVGGNECVMILNIGSKCSSLVFIDCGRFFVRPIPIAGHSITQQISKEFGIPFKDAEELKRKHGFVALGGAYEEPDSEVAATISKIVRNVMTRLHGELNRSINVYRSQQKGNKPVKLYLSGGSSVMAFTPRFFSDKLKIPVEYFNPFQVVSLPEHINREHLAEVAHMFSEVIGLGLRHITSCPIEISLIPDKIKKMQEIKHKTPYFYASAASFVLCLALIYFSLGKQESIDSRKVTLAKSIVESTEKLKGEVDSAGRKKDSLVTEIRDAQNILSGRNNWISVLNALQEKIPDKMWLVSVTVGTGAGAPSGGSAAPEEENRDRPIFPIFARRGGGRAAAAVDAGKVEWIDIEGYFFGDPQAEIDNFKQTLLKTTVFTDKPQEIITREFNPARDDKNKFSSFKMSLKLKTPFNR